MTVARRSEHSGSAGVRDCAHQTRRPGSIVAVADWPGLEQHIDALAPYDQEVMGLILAAQHPFPILHATGAWLDQCGFSPDEVLGGSADILQGKGTSPDAVRALLDGVYAQRTTRVRLTNYTKAHTPFINNLTVKPIDFVDEDCRYFLAVTRLETTSQDALPCDSGDCKCRLDRPRILSPADLAPALATRYSTTTAAPADERAGILGLLNAAAPSVPTAAAHKQANQVPQEPAPAASPGRLDPLVAIAGVALLAYSLWLSSFYIVVQDVDAVFKFRKQRMGSGVRLHWDPNQEQPRWRCWANVVIVYLCSMGLRLAVPVLFTFAKEGNLEVAVVKALHSFAWSSFLLTFVALELLPAQSCSLFSLLAKTCVGRGALGAAVADQKARKLVKTAIKIVHDFASASTPLWTAAPMLVCRCVGQRLCGMWWAVHGSTTCRTAALAGLVRVFGVADPAAPSSNQAPPGPKPPRPASVRPLVVADQRQMAFSASSLAGWGTTGSAVVVGVAVTAATLVPMVLDGDGSSQILGAAQVSSAVQTTPVAWDNVTATGWTERDATALVKMGLTTVIGLGMFYKEALSPAMDVWSATMRGR